MKRFLAGALLLCVLLCGNGCEKKEKGLPVPELGDYEVVVNNRTYTTKGTPYVFVPTVENRGYLDYRTNEFGAVGKELTGTFPEGTQVYGLKGENNKVMLVAVLPENQHCYLVTSHESIRTVTIGRTVVEPLGLHNAFATVYRYSKDRDSFIFLPMTSMELSDLGTAFGEAEIVAPSGKSTELIVKGYNGDFFLFTLYENGAISYAGCPQYTFGLNAEMTAVLWNYING